MLAMRPERGFVLLALVILLGLIGTVLLIGTNTRQAQRLLNDAASERTAYLENTAQAVRGWYRRNAALADANAAALDPVAVLRAAGVEPRFRLRAASTQRLTQGEVGYHDLLVWLPLADPDTSTLDVGTGVFTPAPGARYVRISGAEVQSEALQQTRRALSEASAFLEQYFAARAHVGGRNVSINHFRPDSSCISTGVMPCLDAYVAVTGVDWAAAGVDGLPGRDAWGGDLLVSNLLDSVVASPPFSMALRAVTPWGVVVQAQAVQPL